jgi:hypothetical protein
LDYSCNLSQLEEQLEKSTHEEARRTTDIYRKKQMKKNRKEDEHMNGSTICIT